MNINDKKIKIMKQFAQMVPGTNDVKIRSYGKSAIHIDDTPMHHMLCTLMAKVPGK